MYINIHHHKSVDPKGSFGLHNILCSTLVPELLAGRYYSVGIHPWYIDEVQNQLDVLKLIGSMKQVLAIGEAGLDKKRGAPMAMQQQVFEQQIQLSDELQKPLVVHCVGAFGKLYELRKKHLSSMPWIIHGYNGSVEMMKQLEGVGCYFSFGHGVMNAHGKSATSLAQTPLNKIFLETDESDVPIEDVYRQAAFILNISKETLQEQVLSNFIQVFGRSPIQFRGDC